VDSTSSMPDDVSRSADGDLIQKRALAVLAILSALALFFVALPIGAGLFLGLLTAFTLLPWHEKLAARWHRRGLASLFCAVISWVLVVGALTAIIVLLVVRASSLVDTVKHASEHGGIFERIDEGIAKPLAPFGVHPKSLSSHLQSGAESIASEGAKVVAGVGVIAIKLLLAVGFMILTILYTLHYWPSVVQGLEHLLPLKPQHTKSLLDSTRAIGRQTIVGTIGVGVTQGALATLAYWICGAPDAAFFGAMTAVCSLVPGVGTLCVWVPLGIYLSATGHAGKGIALLLIGAFVVVGFCDGVLRPKLVGENRNTGFFPTIIGLFGGIEIFGVMGLLIGPVIVGFSIAVLRLYMKERALAAPKSLARS
jgi:predicted PurR-regulated permease PerM